MSLIKEGHVLLTRYRNRLGLAYSVQVTERALQEACDLCDVEYHRAILTDPLVRLGINGDRFAAEEVILWMNRRGMF